MSGRGRIIRRGFTLLELTVVVAVLVVLALMVIPLLEKTRDDAGLIGTKTTLNALRDSIAGTPGQPGYWQDVGSLLPEPKTIIFRDLFIKPTTLTGTYDPTTRIGWRGPYLRDTTATYKIDPLNQSGFTAAFGQNGDPAVADAWNNPIIIQFPDANQVSNDAERVKYARLVSAGPDGKIHTPVTKYPAPADRDDDVVLFLFVPDVDPALTP